MDTYEDQYQPQESFRDRAQRPADVLRDGALKATIWENHGEKGPYFTTTLAKTYEDRNGKPRDTHSFSGSDLLRIAELARNAYGRSNELRRDLKQQRDPNGSDREQRDSDQADRGNYQRQRTAPARDRSQSRQPDIS